MTNAEQGTRMDEQLTGYVEGNPRDQTATIIQTSNAMYFIFLDKRRSMMGHDSIALCKKKLKETKTRYPHENTSKRERIQKAS